MTREKLLQRGTFTLSSGAVSGFKLVCDAFIEENADELAWAICEMVGPFGSVEGIPRGGLRLAEALRPPLTSATAGFQPVSGLPLLLVDDVFTTGGSMERHRGGRDAVGVVVFARGPLPSWIRAIFSMPECFWLKR